MADTSILFPALGLQYYMCVSPSLISPGCVGLDSQKVNFGPESGLFFSIPPIPYKNIKHHTFSFVHFRPFNHKIDFLADLNVAPPHPAGLVCIL